MGGIKELQGCCNECNNTFPDSLFPRSFGGVVVKQEKWLIWFI